MTYVYSLLADAAAISLCMVNDQNVQISVNDNTNLRYGQGAIVARYRALSKVVW